MKKRYLIILIAQSVIIFFMFMYAYIQKMEADTYHIEAVRQERIATETMKLSQELRHEFEKLKAEKNNQPNNAD